MKFATEYMEFNTRKKREYINIRANRFEWCSSSDTIRHMPGNYCIAIHITGHWLADIDGAIDESTAALIFTQIRNNQFIKIDNANFFNYFLIIPTDIFKTMKGSRCKIS